MDVVTFVIKPAQYGDFVLPRSLPPRDRISFSVPLVNVWLLVHAMCEIQALSLFVCVSKHTVHSCRAVENKTSIDFTTESTLHFSKLKSSDVDAISPVEMMTNGLFFLCTDVRVVCFYT
jgi:hypothetical protein